MKKRGMELTISTLVVIILALFMLVMGTVLVKKMYCAALTGVNSASELTEQEIQNLFSDQGNNVVVKKLENKVSKGTYHGVGFVVKNIGSSSTGFNYRITVVDLGDCHITKQSAENYIITKKSATFNVASGGTYSDVVEFNIPKEAPLCSLKYQIEVNKDGEFYDSTRFQVIIKQSSWVGSAVC